MPLQGILKGDFSSFVDAVNKAETALKDFQSDADKVQASLNKMGDAFSGKKVIQDAELATKAIKDLGGATTLTQSEQAKLNALLTEAIAKYMALGQNAPPEMVALANATKQVEAATTNTKTATTDMIGTLGKMASAVGIGFSVGAVISFGKSVLDSASQIGDLASQLGISTAAVQGFKFAAEQSGSSLDTVGTALTKMNSNLAGGSDSTVAALKRAGLAFDDIRAMAPEEAFLSITDAIQKIPDPMVQTRVALELFGKSAAELLPAIKDGFRDVSDSASKMSDDTIKALKKSQDSWNELGTKVTVITGKMIADAMDFLDVWKRMQADIDRSTPKAPNAPASGIQTDAGLGISEGELQRAEAALDAVRSKLDAVAEARQRLISGIQGELFGGNAITAARNYSEALGSIANLSKVSSVEQDKINKMMGEAIDVYKRFGQVAPQGMRDLFIATARMPDLIDTATLSIKNLGHEVELTIPTIAQMPKVFDGISAEVEAMLNKVRVGMPEIPKQAKLATASMGDLSQALAQLAQVSGPTFGGIVSSLSSMVAAADAAQKSIKLMRSAGEAKSKFEGILDMASGITGIVSAAIAAGQAVAALFKLFDRNKGRDVVVDFAETFGGFDALHVKLLELGDDGEALWIKLTQGVGRNNPQQAQAVIDEINKKLDEQAKKHDANQTATEEEAQATIETASQAAKALEELGPKLDENAQQWKDWGVVVTGVLQEIANTVRQLPIASPGGSLGFNAGRGGGGGGSVDINVNSYLDGNKIAENTAYHILN